MNLKKNNKNKSEKELNKSCNWSDECTFGCNEGKECTGNEEICGSNENDCTC